MCKIKQENIWENIEGATTNLGFSGGLASPSGSSAFSWVWENLAFSSGYTNWFTGEPNNFGGLEDCSGLYLQKAGLPWNDSSCTNTGNFYCESRFGIHSILNY